jgi:hypothetical protein
MQKLLGQSNPNQNEQLIKKVMMAKFGSLPFNHHVHEDKSTEFSSE